MFKPSKYQSDIFHFVEHGKGSAIIDATAGSGKSTTIIKSLSLISPRKKVIFLAFNKKIATEIKERVPSNISVKTLNALGFAGWRRYMNGQNIKLDQYKVRSIIDNLDIDDQIIKRFKFSVRRLVAVAKNEGIVPEGSPEDCTGLLEDTYENWMMLINHYDISFKGDDGEEGKNPIECKIAIKMAQATLIENLKDLNVIDFDDQMYMTVVYGANCFRHDVVFVDEAQDVSSIQRVLIKNNLRPRGRLIAAGDYFQSIYKFRGADSSSLDKIAKMFECVRLPLSISYRCPKAVIREARKFVNHIEAADNASEGIVKRLGVYNHTFFKKDDYILCRNTAPLIKLAYNLIINKMNVCVLGRDIGNGLIRRIDSFRTHDIHVLTQKLSIWYKRECAKALAKDEEADLSHFEDTFEVINMFVDYSGAESVDELKLAIEDLFSDHSSGITLSTIHRSKGLEADRVFILNSYLMPSKYAKTECDIQQENNLHYVAITRAKKELTYIESPYEKKEEADTISVNTYRDSDNIAMLNITSEQPQY